MNALFRNPLWPRSRSHNLGSEGSLRNPPTCAHTPGQLPSPPSCLSCSLPPPSEISPLALPPPPPTENRPRGPPRSRSGAGGWCGQGRLRRAPLLSCSAVAGTPAQTRLPEVSATAPLPKQFCSEDSKFPPFCSAQQNEPAPTHFGVRHQR